MDNKNFDEDDELIEDLISFLRDKSGYDGLINQDTLMEDGLGVTGDDGEELISDFSKRYNVDISEFKFCKYFNDEPNFFQRARIVKPLKLKDLALAIKTGKLE